MIRWIKYCVKAGIALGLLGLIAASIYCWHLTGLVEDRFSGRKWQIPSVIYSDTTLLYTGRKVNLDSFKERLKGIGYRPTGDSPHKKGDYRVSGNELEIYLNDLNVPGKTRFGFPLLLTLKNNAIASMVRRDSGQPVPILELEPEVLMRYFGKTRELRQVVPIDEIPESLQYAVMAAEDARFYTHFGIDPRGILRAVYTNLRHGAIRQGGSTLTQQLAKNYFLTPERTFSRKLNELFISLAIELKYGKDEILGIYLNEIYFGQKGSASVNGAGEAAKFYFNKRVQDLSLAESATIAGLIKGPNLYSPYRNMERSLKRRNSVLDSMFKNGWITAADLEEASATPIKVSGFQAYSQTAPYFLDYVSSQVKEVYPATTLSSMGFSIFTTLDTQVQAAAERALDLGLARLEQKNPKLKRSNPAERLQGAIVVLQPRTGNILAMVGGRDYKVSQFNRATQAKRQPGSCFKPIVASVLLDQFKPSDILSNEKTDYVVDNKTWTPNNFSEQKEKSLTVRDMLRVSSNRAAVDMLVRGGTKRTANRLKQFHLSTPVPPWPSMVLGASEVIPMELARAYAVFASDGIQPYPLSLKDVMDETGEFLVGRRMEIEPVLSPGEAYLITSMLESAVKKGTGRALARYGVDFPVAGKTGTTNNFRDAWFVGYTPDLLALVWVGFDNNEPIYATGGSAALPIWAELVSAIPGYVSGNAFVPPPDVVNMKVCRESGNRADGLRCPDAYDEYFLETNLPDDTCSLHSGSSLLDRMGRGIKQLFN
ncbi:penicillin-binding protein 1B [Desulfoluna limicola]|uniref:peptidoglycan glycosyltransferase n=1 Tax=Desulfoluna limicola TaxID=2810562 RepID=A0ABN6F1Q0_9BACT|nr:PBP1A family penicillin-binding protein [Desulfoluna limicola]BCS95728.1 penicillin-binding protein 1B [Desulfoluna limicola]